MIEGTRHERAAIVTASYIIGFITAFIAFGATVGTDEVVPALPQSATVIESIDTTVPTQEPDEVASEQAVMSLHYTEAGLVLKTPENERLLSAAQVIGATLSPNEHFVYFCEVADAAGETCQSLIYDIQNNSLVPVTVNATALSLPATAHRVTWSEAGLATVAGQRVN